MKLKQLHNSSVVTCEITDVALRINTRRLIKSETQEILFENILIKDLYELKHISKPALAAIPVFFGLFCFFAEHNFGSSHPDWRSSIVFASLTLLFIVRYMIKRTKIYIPTKDKGMIRLYKKQPSKSLVQQFIYVLEGKVELAVRKRPEKRDLKEFIRE